MKTQLPKAAIQTTLFAALSVALLAMPGYSAVPGAVKQASGFGKVPLQFEANQGQSDKAVCFLTHGPGYSLFLKPAEAVFVGNQQKPAVIRMHLVGSNLAAPMTGEEPLSGRVNYLSGSDPKQWVTNVATCQRVRATGVYKGIDLIYYGTRSQIEYDFVVKPGSDPGTIKLAMASPAQAKIDQDGALTLSTANGQLRWKAPVVYQTGTTGRRISVAAKYFQDSRRQIGFHLGKYDPNKPLVIDPVATYVTYLGETEDESGYAIATDSAGCAYVTGNASFRPFPVTVGSYQTNGSGVFVSKFNASGTALIYSTFIGNYGSNTGYGIAVDSHGDACITGQVQSGFPTTAGAYRATSSLGGAFVAQLDPSGSSLLYSTYLTNDYTAWGSSLAVDSSGDIWITGAAGGSFPITGGGLSVGGGIVAKLDPTRSGSASLIYSTHLGGTSPNGDAGLGIAVDGAGNAYVGGQTSSSDFPTTPGAYQPHFGGGRSFGNTKYGPFYGGEGDGFITKFSPTGTVLYSTYLGGVADDFVRTIAVDAQGNAYVTGDTSSDNFPITPGVYSPGQGGGAFVTKLNPSGSALVYSTYIGGPGQAQGIAVDALGDVFLAGWTNYPTIVTPDAYQSVFGGGGTDTYEGDGFIEELDPAAKHLLYSTYLGGLWDDACYGIAIDTAGDIYVAGKTFSSNLPVTPNAFQTVFGNGPIVDIYHNYGDVFLAKFVVNSLVPSINSLSGTPPGLSPASASAGGPGFLLTVSGSSFSAGAVLSFGGTPLATTIISATKATATVPAAQIASAGTAAVSITNPAPGSAASHSVLFTIAAPISTWHALQVAAGDKTHILWDNTDGRASVWNYTPASGGFTQNTYGPYGGWSAVSIADGGTDGRTRVLWNKTDGTASIWNLNNTTGQFSQFSFGPYSGWTAKTLSVGIDSITHVLWTNTDGTASLWNYTTSTGGFTQNTYGPYGGWSAVSIADGGTDGKTRVLWNKTDGTASIWSLNTTTGQFSQFSFGPYSGWTALAISIGTDNTTHVLWTNTNGMASLWNYSTASGSFTQSTYGPYSGWSALGIGDGPDGKTRVLWNKTDGAASLWSLDNAAGIFSQFSFGPY